MARSFGPINSRPGKDFLNTQHVYAQEVARLAKRTNRNTRVIGGTNGLQQSDLMAGDPASEAGVKVTIDELTPELQEQIENGSGGVIDPIVPSDFADAPFDPAVIKFEGGQWIYSTPATGSNVPGNERAIAVTFTYADGPVFSLGNLTPGQIIVNAELEITNAFDGVGANIRLGTVANPDLLFAATENKASSTATYQNGCNYSITANEFLRVLIDPGVGATKGSGRVVVTVRDQ